MDNFFRTLGFGKKRELGGQPISTTTEPPEDSNQPSGTNYRTKLQRVYEPKDAMKISAYYRAEELVSETIASLTMQYLRWNNAQKCYIKDTGRYRGNRINYLLSTQPNPRQNKHQFFKNLVWTKRNRGNGIIYIDYDMEGELRALYSLTTVPTYDITSNTYSFHDENLRLHRDNVPARYIIHIRNLSANGSMWGESIIEHARQALTIGATLQEESKNRIATGGRMKGFVSFDSNVDGFSNYAKEQKEKAVETFRQGFEDYDINLLPSDAKFTPMSLTSADLQFIESEKFSIADVSRYTGVPMSLLSDASGSVYKSQTETYQIFLKSCILPIVDEIENEFNAKLVPYQESGVMDKFEFDRRELTKVDPKTEAEINKILLESGVICPNELRAMHNLPPVEKGDIHYVSTNLAELGSDKLRGINSNPIASPEPNVEPNNEKEE